MTEYVITYRLVKGSPIDAEEHDGSLHNLDDRVTVLEEAVVPNIIQDISLVGTDLVFTMDDYSTFNAGELPTAEWNPRGTWAPDTAYVIRDIFQEGGVVYKVIFNHVSEATFDPAANDGAGNDYYMVILDLKYIAPPCINTSSTTLTTILAHANSYIRCQSATGTTVEILSDDVVSHNDNTEITYRVCEEGAPVGFIWDEEEVTVNVPTGFDPIASRKGAVVVIKKVIGADSEWDIFGMLDLAEAES